MFLLLQRLLGEHWRALMRFPAARRTVAFAIALALMVASRLFVGLPSGFEAWPAEARDAAVCLIEGPMSLAIAAWLWLATRPLNGFMPDRFRLALRVVRGVSALAYGEEGIALLLRGGWLLQQLPAPGVARIIDVACVAVVTPLATGAVPLAVHFGAEWVSTSAFYRRLFRSGNGADGGWLHPHEMKPYLRPLPKAPK
jgi:hypothetical protein